MSNFPQYPCHDILREAWDYEIFTLSFHQSPIGEFEPFLDLTLKKDNVFRYLRFHSPKDLEIEKGFPARAGGFCIFDASSAGMDGVGIRVDDVRNGNGAIRFWARDVVEIGHFARVDNSIKFE